MTTSTHTTTGPIPSRPEIRGFNAVFKGCVLRPATPEEIQGWLACNGLTNHLTATPRSLARAWAFSCPRRIDGVLIDTDTGPGSNMLGCPLG